MAQQRYIYPPTTVDGLQALYSNPVTQPGTTTTGNDILQYNMLYDRIVPDNLELPYTLDQITVKPNELANSTTIFNSIETLHKNFLYLNTRATLASNDLPGQYIGYYTSSPSAPELSVFNSSELSQSLPLLDPTSDLPEALTGTEYPGLSSILNGEDLNSLTTGTWLRDNSLIDTDSIYSAGEHFHFGFLASKTSLTVVKMSNVPEHLQVDYGTDGKPTGRAGWLVVDRYTSIQDLPSDKNSIEYNNITKIKSDGSEHIYVLDSGEPRSGVQNISTSSQRSVIYKYNVSGFLNVNDTSTIEKGKRILVSTLGDLNTITNQSDIIKPIAFTIGTDNNIIVYDEHDYTFKVFDRNNNFIKKYAKRTVFFRGAAGKEKTYLGVADIHFDTTTSTYYVLTPGGYMFVFDNDFNLLSRIIIPRGTSNESKELPSEEVTHNYYAPGNPGDPQYEVFTQLEFSKNEQNVYYVLTNHRIVKRFKSREDYSVGVYNFLDNNIGTPTHISQAGYRASLKFMSIVYDANVQVKTVTNDENDRVLAIDLERTYTYDQIYVYTGFLDLQASTVITLTETEQHFITSFQERDNVASSLIDDDYHIYNINDTTTITHKEYTSDIVYNKAIYKILFNHLRMIKLLNYRLAGSHTPVGNLVYKERRYLEEGNYRDMLFEIDDSYFVGINEYCSTAVINRCFRQIYNIQKQILQNLQPLKLNKWPLESENTFVEPYTFTDGTVYQDVDGVPYTGYYFILEQTGGDIPVAGRTTADGTITNGSPTTDRYLTPISTG